jgi:hypothetical protein
VDIVNWQRLILPALILLLILGVLCKVESILTRPANSPVIPDTWSKPLQERGYREAENRKPDNIPDGKEPPAGEPVLHGTGTVEYSGDTLQVEMVGVGAPDGSRWLTGYLKGPDGIDRQIMFDRLDWWIPEHDDRSDFSLIAECAFINGPDMGVGLAWEPLEFYGVNAGLAGTIDLNRDLLDSPDWAALSARLSRSFGPISAGGHLGYRIGEERGLHTGVALGVAVGL